MFLFNVYQDDVHIAYGCMFPTGKCVVVFKGEHNKVVIWDSLQDMRENIGLEGKIRIVFFNESQ